MWKPGHWLYYVHWLQCGVTPQSGKSLVPNHCYYCCSYWANVSLCASMHFVVLIFWPTHFLIPQSNSKKLEIIANMFYHNYHKRCNHHICNVVVLLCSFYLQRLNHLKLPRLRVQSEWEITEVVAVQYWPVFYSYTYRVIVSMQAYISIYSRPSAIMKFEVLIVKVRVKAKVRVQFIHARLYPASASWVLRIRKNVLLGKLFHMPLG